MAPAIRPALPQPLGPLDPERIREIAASLDDTPGGSGDPMSERETWSGLSQLQSFQEVVSTVVATAKEPLPELTEAIFLHYLQTGKQTAYAEFEGTARPGFAKLVLAECIDNQGLFLDRIHHSIDALCAEPTWVHSFHDPLLNNWQGKTTEIDLRVASISWSLSTACHFLGDRLQAETRSRVRQELEQRTFAPFLSMLDGSLVMFNQKQPFSWLEVRHNWNASCLGGVVSCALTMIESKQERARYVAAAERYICNFLSGFPDDGSCSEGIGYWGGGFSHFVMLAENLWQATRGAVDLLADEHVKLVAQYGARLEIMPGTYPAFADCHPGTTPPAGLMQFVSRRYSLGLRSWEATEPEPSNLQSLAVYGFPNSATANSGSAIEPAGGAKDHSSTAPAAKGGLRSWFAEAGLYVGRSRLPGAIGVAFKGGHNGEFHNHNDLGSFVVGINGKLLLTDPGAEKYTARTFSDRRYDSNLLNSYGHSVPIVGGSLQSSGSAARAAVVRTTFDDGEDRVTYDLLPAYEVEDLESLERTFIFSRRQSGRLTVRDAAQFRSPQTFGTALITTDRWRQVDTNRLEISDGEDALRMDVKVEGGDFEIAPETIEEEARSQVPPTRIGINLTAPVDRAVIEIVVEPCRNSRQEQFR